MFYKHCDRIEPARFIFTKKSLIYRIYNAVRIVRIGKRLSGFFLQEWHSLDPIFDDTAFLNAKFQEKCTTFTMTMIKIEINTKGIIKIISKFIFEVMFARPGMSSLKNGLKMIFRHEKNILTHNNISTMRFCHSNLPRDDIQLALELRRSPENFCPHNLNFWVPKKFQPLNSHPSLKYTAVMTLSHSDFISAMDIGLMS